MENQKYWLFLLKSLVYFAILFIVTHSVTNITKNTVHSFELLEEYREIVNATDSEQRTRRLVRVKELEVTYAVKPSVLIEFLNNSAWVSNYRSLAKEVASLG